MQLLIDMGNSRLKWAIWEQGMLTQHGSFIYSNSILIDVWKRFTSISAVIISSVANRNQREQLVQWCQQRWACSVEILHTGNEAYGVINGYLEPSTLGIDRWAAMIAAQHLHSGPKIIIDCGTAITVDIIDASGMHCGGMIAPGLALMVNSLRQDTAGIHLDKMMDYQSLPGRDTQTGVASGVFTMFDGFIEGIRKKWLLKLGDGTQLILTGGDADYFYYGHASGDVKVVSDLVLQGVALLSGLMLGEK